MCYDREEDHKANAFVNITKHFRFGPFGPGAIFRLQPGDEGPKVTTGIDTWKPLALATLRLS